MQLNCLLSVHNNDKHRMLNARQGQCMANLKSVSDNCRPNVNNLMLSVYSQFQCVCLLGHFTLEATCQPVQ